MFGRITPSAEPSAVDPEHCSDALSQVCDPYHFSSVPGIFKDVRFLPTMNFGHFGDPPSPLTFHNVKNHGGGGAEGEPGGIARNGTKEKKKTTY